MRYSEAYVMQCGSTGTPKAHAERQLKMLLIASKLLKKNGILLYTTCSLSELENDGVSAKHLTSSPSDVTVEASRGGT